MGAKKDENPNSLWVSFFGQPVVVTSCTGVSISALRKPRCFLSCCSSVMFASVRGTTHCRLQDLALWLCEPVQLEARIQDGSYLKCVVFLIVWQPFCENSLSWLTHTWSSTRCMRHLTQSWEYKHRVPTYYLPPPSRPAHSGRPLESFGHTRLYQWIGTITILLSKINGEII